MRISLFCLLFFPAALTAQLPFTQANQYGYWVEKDLVYATAVNYMGATDTLRLDLYKPLNDGNTQRPLLVLAHGGSWLGGCKKDMDWLATEMVGRGYVVAAVNYRLGWHKDHDVAAPDCLLDGTQKNLYAADSCEILRAIFRGQQDVKSAIRWLKARHALDSTDICRVLVGGESAGGFLALATGFLDRPSEKPDCCYALDDVPLPDPALYNQTTLDCILKSWPIPPGTTTRPDLGPIDGENNLNGYDANVMGVVSFYGGVPYDALSKDWLGGPDTPAIYLYHMTCDGIVPFGYSQPYFTLSYYCNTGCTPWHGNYPHTFGSGSVAAFFDASPNPPCFTTDFVNCDAFNPNIALFDCLRYADVNNGSYHYTANRPLRAQHAADFFAPLLNDNTACGVTLALCNTTATAAPDPGPGWNVAPNPFRDRLTVWSEQAGPVQIDLTNTSGQQLWQGQTDLHAGHNTITVPGNLPPGAYVLRLRSADGARSWVLIREQ